MSHPGRRHAHAAEPPMVGRLDTSYPAVSHDGPPSARTSQSPEITITPDPADAARAAPIGRWRKWGAAPYVAAADALALLVAGLLLGSSVTVTAIGSATGLTTLGLLRMYQARLHLSLLDDVPRLLAAAFVTVGATTVAAVSSGVASFDLHAVTMVLAVLAALVLARSTTYVLLRQARRSGRARHTALVVGAGHVGIRLANALRDHREYGLDPIGFLDSEPRIDQASQLPAPLLGSWHDIAHVVRENRVSRIIVAFASLPESELVEVLRTSAGLKCDIYYVPRLFELHNTSREVDDVRGIPLIRLRRSALRSVSWKLKRVFDILVSGTTLVLLSPVMAVCAIAVRIESGPGFLFRQQRVGLDGRTFDMLKFRSMRPANEAEAQTTWTIKDDDRVGRVGKLLRSTSLDELPQLWNVLTGDMSLVGPRPERPHFVTHFTAEVPRYKSRHRVPAGITGWAQVNHLRGDTSIAERALFDNYYIENWSLWWDLKIILRTAGQVFRRRGE